MHCGRFSAVAAAMCAQIGQLPIQGGSVHAHDAAAAHIMMLRGREGGGAAISSLDRGRLPH